MKLSTTAIPVRRFRPITKTKIPIFIAGTGAVGSTLIQQIQQLNHPRFQLEIIGHCDSRLIHWAPAAAAHPSISAETSVTDWALIPQNLFALNRENLVFVDATGSEIVARQYAELLQNGVHVVTPSKRANTFEQAYFDELAEITHTTKSRYRFETSVGAGLPVIGTMQGLLNSGDNITEISGVVSGTMTFIFNRIEQGMNFSQAVTEAKALGYAEPDPRDDLSGEDVARKFLILARICGGKFERRHVQVEALFPEDMARLTAEEFLEALPRFDTYWKQRQAKALVNNQKLRYVGKFTEAGIEIGIREVPANSPLGGLKGTDNLIQIFSKRYSASPIVIQGPGAGKDVTAAGILADLMEIVDSGQI